MALLDFHFHSDCLQQAVSAEVILPQFSKSQIGMQGKQEKTYKTLYLLHGLSDDETIWLRRTSIERYAAKYGIAVVMPCTARAWYTNTTYGEKYYTFISEELPNICRTYFAGMSDKREDNFIAGLSMGGYGATKIAFNNLDKYAGVAAFSGAFDIPRRVKTDDPVKSAYWKSIFGDLNHLEGTEHDIYALANKLDVNKNIPMIYLSCGLSDGLLGEAQRLKSILDARSIPCEYKEAPGTHDWQFWDNEIQSALQFFFENK